MFRPKEIKEKPQQGPKQDEDLRFCWGLRKESVKLYESFTLDGTEYVLYDCVYMWREGQAEPDIGKLVRIWEMENHAKKVEIVWFFRPSEITHWLGDFKPLQREIFLACGHGKGLSNLNPLEAISGKCNVVCSSKHKRNPQPTEDELRRADFIFSHTFDVEKCLISDIFPSSIGGIEVDHFFNRRRSAKPSAFSEPKAHSKSRIKEIPIIATKDNQCARVEKGDYRSNTPGTCTGGSTNNPVKNASCSGAKLKRSGHCLSTSSSNVLKKRKLLVSPAEGPRDDALPCAPTRVSGQEKHITTKDSCRENKDLSTRKSLDEKTSRFPDIGPSNKQHVSRDISYKYKEVTRRPFMDSSKWLKLEVWSEERLNEANEKGTLVVLQNLDPSFTSAEVEDIIWSVFEQKVKAKMVQHTATSSPHSGEALVIFKTREAADIVISELIKRCLVLGDGRPIIGRRKKLGGGSGRFFGHLSIQRTRPQRQREEIRNAVATSHHSQGNTIEFEMAIHWLLLQKQSDMCWRTLHEEQGNEIEALMKQMKIRNQE